MAGNKCQYYNCGLSRHTDKTLRFYRFPINDTERCKAWILNSGNGTLSDLSPKSLRQRLICSKHFSAEQIQMCKLPCDAVPSKYVTDSSSDLDVEKSPEMKIRRVSRVYRNTSNVSPQANFSEGSGSTEIENFEGVQNLPVPKKRKNSVSLKKENDMLKKKINSLKTQLYSTKKKIMKKQLFLKNILKDNTSQFSASIVNMQLAHSTRRPWTNSEKKTALSLYYKSPSTYKYMRQKGIILPATSTIKKWLGNFNCWPGFNKKVLEQLKFKAETMTDAEKICIVMFDEMSLKRNLDYNQKVDRIEGIVDLGSLGRKPLIGNQVLVFMIRGIYSSWKLSVAYFVSKDGVSAQELQILLLNCLNHLRIVKLRPIATVCDVSAVNQKLYRQLDVTIEKPFFVFDKTQYFALFDTPHLLKCLRNNFLNSTFIYKHKRIAFSDISKVFEIDNKSQTGRCLLKLTHKHLNPGAFEKMNVKLAAQLFSNSVAAALNVATRTGELQSTTAENTTYFVRTINNLFDALNSTHFKNSNPYNRVLSDKNHQVLEALDSGHELLTNLQKLNKHGQLSRPPSFNGFLQTINAVKMIFSIQKEKGFSFLFTGRLIQDPLENQFSIYRQKGGYNRNPSVKSFRAAFKINMVSNLIKPSNSANSGTNVDNDENIFEYDHKSAAESLNILENNEDISSASSNTSESDSAGPSNIENRGFMENFSLENCSSTYFAGYLVKKVLKKFNCDSCRTNLEGEENLDNVDELLIFYKNFDIENDNLLKTPTDSMKQFTKNCMIIFSKNMSKLLSRKVIANLKRKIILQLEDDIMGWFNKNCQEHMDYVLELLLRTLIFKYCKTVSKSITPQSRSKNVKLSILQHR